MKPEKMNRLLVIIASLLMVIPVCAQTNKKQKEQPFKERVEATKIAYFTDKLELTSQEAQVFWPVYNKWWNEKQEAYDELHKSIDAIIALEEKGNYSDPEMKKLINHYSECLTLESKVFEMYIDEFYKILPTHKVAKIFVAEKGFRDILTKMWRDAKRKDSAPQQKDSPKKPENK